MNYVDSSDNKKTEHKKENCEKSITITSIYSNEYEDEVYRSDILEVIPNQLYKMVITLESCDEITKIIPTITMPKKKGFMKVRGETYFDMISICNSMEKPICEVEILSELGYIDISYHCEKIDHRNKPYWGSSKILRPLGMKKEIISSSKVRYYCTDMKSGLFDRYIFTLEWFAI